MTHKLRLLAPAPKFQAPAPIIRNCLGCCSTALLSRHTGPPPWHTMGNPGLVDGYMIMKIVCPYNFWLIAIPWFPEISSKSTCSSRVLPLEAILFGRLHASGYILCFFPFMKVTLGSRSTWRISFACNDCLLVLKMPLYILCASLSGHSCLRRNLKHLSCIFVSLVYFDFRTFLASKLRKKVCRSHILKTVPWTWIFPGVRLDMSVQCVPIFVNDLNGAPSQNHKDCADLIEFIFFLYVCLKQMVHCAIVKITSLQKCL